MNKERLLTKINSLIDDIEIFEEIDSTNLYALRDINKQFNRLIIANNQTNGQGRFGKKFFSYRNCGLYFTLDVNKSLIDEKNVMMKMGVAITNVLNNNYQKKVKIKWVNDIYEEGKKVCGILIQSVENKIVIGVGLNLYQPSEGYDDVISNKVAALFNEKIDCELLLTSIVNEFLKEIPLKVLLAEYKKNSLVLNSWVYYYQYDKDLFVKDITNEGNLVTNDKAGREFIINSGQIEIGGE